MENWLRRNEHGIKALVAVLAAIFTLIQYFGHIKEIRVEKTLGFYERFSTEPIFSARTRVLEKWEILEKRLARLPKPGSREEAVAQRKQWKEIVVSGIKGDAIFATNTDIMFDFFDALQVCIENNICDKKSAHELMQEAARMFFGNNCPYVAHTRFDQNIKNFGAKAAAFADYPCNVDIFNELSPKPSLLEPPRDKTAQRP